MDGQRALLAEARNGALLIVAVGEAHVDRALRVAVALLLPRLTHRRRALPLLHHRGRGMIQRPRVVAVERLGNEVGLMRLGEEHDVLLHRLELRAKLLPEVHRDVPRDVHAIAVDVVLLDPVHVEVRHVLAELGALVVELRHVAPVVRREHLALGVAHVEPGRLEHHVVPRGVVGDFVDEDLDPLRVGGLHEALEVGLGAVARVHLVVVLHRVRAADRALALHLPDGVNGHQPDDGDAELLEPRQTVDDALEIAARGEGAREDLVDHTVLDPFRRGPGGELGHVALRGEGRGGQGAGERERNKRGGEEPHRRSPARVGLRRTEAATAIQACRAFRRHQAHFLG